jgi:hypothetical protein
MRFYDVPVNQSVPTEANRSLTSYRVKVCCFDVGVLLGRVSRLADAHGNMSYQLVHAEYHFNYYKDEAVTTRTIAIIARCFDGVIAIGLLYNLYHVYLDGRLMARPQLLTFGGAASAASGDDGQAATPPDCF